MNNRDWKRWQEVCKNDYENISEDSPERERNYLRKFASDSQVKKKEVNVWTPKGYKYIVKDSK